MFKKILLIILIPCPLFFLFVGYPVNDKSTYISDRFQVSSRCFEVGNMSQFIGCLLPIGYRYGWRG